jgi:hypothetical protein
MSGRPKDTEWERRERILTYAAEVVRIARVFTTNLDTAHLDAQEQDIYEELAAALERLEAV